MREKILSLKFLFSLSLAERNPFFSSNRFEFRDLFELIPWLWAEWNFTFYHPQPNNFVPFFSRSKFRKRFSEIDR